MYIASEWNLICLMRPKPDKLRWWIPFVPAGSGFGYKADVDGVVVPRHMALNARSNAAVGVESKYVDIRVLFIYFCVFMQEVSLIWAPDRYCLLHLLKW